MHTTLRTGPLFFTVGSKHVPSSRTRQGVSLTSCGALYCTAALFLHLCSTRFGLLITAHGTACSIFKGGSQQSR